MSKDKISQYSATAGSNTDVAGVSIAEGTAPSNINNAIRALMAHLKDMDAGTQALTSPALTSATITNATLGGLTYPTSDGSANQYLQTNGSGALSWSTVATTTNLASAVTGTLPVGNGGTGATTLTDNSVLTGTGTSAITAEGNLTFNGSTLAVTGDVSASGSFIIGSASIAEAELEQIDGVTAGTVSASKAVVVDSNKDITGFRNITNTGSITASGNITAYSDERLKSDVKTITNALNKVLNLRGVTYTKSAEKGMGVIAQEVEPIIPEVVSDGEYKSVAYGNLVGVLIEAIKELNIKIHEVKEGCNCNAT